MYRRDSVQQNKGSSLRGVFAATLTPMDGDLNPDHEAFVAHCHRLLDAGCHGLSVFGTTGEANSLSVEERLAALDVLVEEGIPAERLLPGTGSCALSEAVGLSRAALEAGTGGVLVLPPFYYKNVSDEGVFRFFAELIERVSHERLRVYLYHFPQMTGVGFSLSLIERLLGAYPGIIAGTKDSSGDWTRIERTCQAFPGFSVFAGTEGYLLNTLEQAGAGCISATVNVTSRLARRVYDAHEAGREKEARELQEHLTEVRTAIEAFPQVPALKSIIAYLTKEESWRNLRPPLVSLEDGQERKLLDSLLLSELL
jgi:4-hydroxy-tetrahydrodipicolinate synthase